MIRVLVVDDHPVVRGGLVGWLAAQADLDVVGEAADGLEALAAVAEHQPDVVLMMDRGGEAHDGAGAFALPALAETPAGRNKALIKMDALYLLGFGPRTPAAARDLAARLYPALALAKP